MALGAIQYSRCLLRMNSSLPAAAGEAARTISAQILRVAVYTWGEDQQTLVNMTNPEAHAMIYYAQSDDYDELLVAARRAADDIRGALADIAGESVSIQQSPLRTEKHYRKYKNDGRNRIYLWCQTEAHHAVDVNRQCHPSTCEKISNNYLISPILL